MASTLAGDQVPLAGAEAMRLAFVLAREQELPLEVGRLSWSHDGVVSLRDGSGGARFSFFFRGLPFSVEVEEGEDLRLVLVGNLGKVPFTAEAPDARRVLKRIAAASQRLPRGTLAITREQDLQLRAVDFVPGRATPVRVIATVVALLLDFLPFLDLAEAALSSSRIWARAT